MRGRGRRDVASIFLPARGDVPSPRVGEESPAGEDGARATRGWRWRTGEDGAGKGLLSSPLLSSLPLLLLPFFSLNRPPTIDFSLNQQPTAKIDRRQSISPSIDRRWPKSTGDDRFWWYCLVAGGLHTGNLTDRYVLPVLGSTDRNCKPCFKPICCLE
ncbi:hypothetical protein BHM03_00006048 [Ensete ventricosum]|nr:hypothetical protein BHM03_00006048 [Ensete ventricosum]